MKTLFVFLSSLLSVCFFSGTPLSERFESYVDTVVIECENWTKEDWGRSKEIYRNLLQEYKDNKSSFTEEEIKSIDHSIGKYNGLLLKKGMQEAGDAIGNFADRVPSLIDGFVDVFKSEDNQ